MMLLRNGHGSEQPPCTYRIHGCVISTYGYMISTWLKVAVSEPLWDLSIYWIPTWTLWGTCCRFTIVLLPRALFTNIRGCKRNHRCSRLAFGVVFVVLPLLRVSERPVGVILKGLEMPSSSPEEKRSVKPSVWHRNGIHHPAWCKGLEF